MDSAQADPDLQADVDILILDYLLCLTIETILSGRRAEREGHQPQWDGDWLLNSVNTFRSILPVSLTPPQDLSIKLRVLAFASHFLMRYTRSNSLHTLQRHESNTPNGIESATASRIRQVLSLLPTDTSQTDQDTLDRNYHSMLQQLRVHPDNAPPRRRLIPLSWIIREFIDLCVTTTMKESDSHWLDIAAQLTAQAIAEEFWIFASVSSEELHGRLIWVPSDPSMTVEWDRLCEKYMNRLQLPPDTPWEVRPEETPTALPLYHLEEVVIDFLLNLMKSLDAPVLVQLERGKLGGLTRAETQSLKDRIGI